MSTVAVNNFTVTDQATTTTDQATFVTCPNCDKRIRYASQLAGKLGRCSSCKTRLRMPPLASERPESQLSEEELRYYTAGQIAGATFVGGLMAGGTLMALNAARLGKASQAAGTMVASLFATVLLIVALMALPVPGPFSYLLLFAQAGVMLLASKSMFAEQYEQQKAIGMKHAKRPAEALMVVLGWIAVWVGLYFAALSLA